MLSVVIMQALANGHLRREDIDKLSIVLKTVSLVASYEEEPKGMSQLLDKGLTHMISDKTYCSEYLNHYTILANGSFSETVYHFKLFSQNNVSSYFKCTYISLCIY